MPIYYLLTTYLFFHLRVWDGAWHLCTVGLVLISWLPRGDLARVAVLLLSPVSGGGNGVMTAGPRGQGWQKRLNHDSGDEVSRRRLGLGPPGHRGIVVDGDEFLLWLCGDWRETEVGDPGGNIRLWGGGNLRPDHPTEDCNKTPGVSDCEEPGLSWDGSYHPSHIWADIYIRPCLSHPGTSSELEVECFFSNVEDTQPSVDSNREGFLDSRRVIRYLTDIQTNMYFPLTHHSQILLGFYCDCTLPQHSKACSDLRMGLRLPAVSSVLHQYYFFCRKSWIWTWSVHK